MTSPSAPRVGHRYRAMLSRVGPCAPIEERIGRRLVRLVPPDTEDGLRLLRAGRVSLVGPEGEDLGLLPLSDALRILRDDLQTRLDAASAGTEREAIRDGLDTLRSWEGRCRDC